MQAWEAHDPTLTRPIAAPLERCAELLGVDLATVLRAALHVEPYARVDGTKIWSLMQLGRQLRPQAYGRVRAATSPADAPGPSTPDPASGTRMAARCSFCGSTTGPFSQIEGLFTVLMCADCQATRGHGTGPYPVMTRAQMRASLDLLPTWVLEQKAWGRVGYSSLRTS
jgi:hypothetical protein